jgi:3'(2'), 5'-bisphosphate nucleotidase
VWDHAPGVVLVEEAGGRVTDARGRPLDFSQGAFVSNSDGVVATNGILHDAVLEQIAKLHLLD